MSNSPNAVTPLLRSDAAAAILGLQPQTLRAWRLRGFGPRYVRVGHGDRGRVFYRHEDLVAWLESRTFASTSEETVSARRAAARREGGAVRT